MSDQVFESWAILELMGHRRRAGLVKEVEMGGGKLLRIDIPIEQAEGKPEEFVTEFYGASAIYALRPSSEEIARRFVKENYGGDPRPVAPVGYRLPAPAAAEPDQDGDQGDEPF